MTTLSELFLSVRMDNASVSRIALCETADVGLPRITRVCAHFVLRGSVNVPQAQGSPIRLETGDFICFPRGDEHRLRGSQPGRSNRLHLGRGELTDEPAPFSFGDGENEADILTCVFGLGPLANRQAHSLLPSFLLVRCADGVFPTFSVSPTMFASLSGPGSSAFACNLVRLLYDQSIQGFLARSGMTVEVAGLRWLAVGQAMRLMDGQLSQGWTVAGLAHATGMSRSAFAAAFTELHGIPPLAHLTRRRMAEAHRLLRHDQLPIGEVAALVGYRSQSAFTRAFTQHFQMTPREARSRVPQGPVSEPHAEDTA